VLVCALPFDEAIDLRHIHDWHDAWINRGPDSDLPVVREQTRLFLWQRLASGLGSESYGKDSHQIDR